jgi:hypothetical protein
MPDAAYHRAQAKLCREIAKLLSNVEDAQQALEAADHHDQRAHLAENKSNRSDLSRSDEESDPVPKRRTG